MPPILAMFRPHSLHRALSDSVASGVFIDTKFCLFSCRNSSGKAVRPRPLYANSQILKSVPYFDAREPSTTFAIDELSCAHPVNRFLEFYPEVSPKARQEVLTTNFLRFLARLKTTIMAPTATSRTTMKLQNLSQRPMTQRLRIKTRM